MPLGWSDFDNQAGRGSQYKLGYNLGIMLKSVLNDSSRFVIVERQNLDSVLQEQDLQNSNRTAHASKSVQMGSLRSACYLVTGAITEFEERQAGDSGGVRIRGFKIGASGGTAQITAIVKLVDTTTGEIVAKERVVGKAGRTGFSVGYHRGWCGGAGCDHANRDLLCRRDGGLRFHSLRSHGVEDGRDHHQPRFHLQGYPGQSFIVEEEGKQLVDPDTGEILSEAQGEMIAQIRCLRV